MISIRFTKTGVVGITKAQLREVGRAAIHAAAEYWWKMFLPIHFTKRASKRYGYIARGGEMALYKGSYSWAKLHKKIAGGVAAIGEVKPLVWSGRSRASALSTKNITAVAKNFREYQGRVAINAPALNFLASKGMGFVEVIRTTPDEDAEMAAVFLREFEAQLNTRGRTRTTTIKAA